MAMANTPSLKVSRRLWLIDRRACHRRGCGHGHGRDRGDSRHAAMADVVGEAVPLLQLPALSGATTTVLKTQKGLSTSCGPRPWTPPVWPSRRWRGVQRIRWGVILEV